MVCSSSALAFLSLTLLGVENALSFSCFATTTPTTRPITFLGSSPSENNSGAEDKIDAELVETSELTEENIEAVGNLVADDEWAGVTLELGELVRTAVIEDIKSNAREFLGKEEYKVGDLSKEIDERVKQGVADLRGKDNYEVGDLVLTLDEMSKSMTEELTGKPYEVGDLSKEIDSRVKGAVASYIGKDEYEAGDLTKAIAGNVKTRVEELTENYEFGDIFLVKTIASATSLKISQAISLERMNMNSVT